MKHIYSPMIFYLEISLFCLLILGVILMKACASLDKRQTWSLFKQLLATVMGTLVLDVCWRLEITGCWSLSRVVRTCVNAAYFSAIGFSAYLWFCYTDSLFDTRILNSRKGRVIALIPLVLLCLLSLDSGQTDFLFVVDARGRHHRGIGYVLYAVLVYGYLAVASVKGVYLATRKEHYAERQKYLAVESFTLPVVITGIAQMRFEQIPLLCVGVTLAALMAYLNAQELQISMDPLTGMNNRGHLLQYLSKKMKNHQAPLYLVMIDVDHFKSINDQYGHVEGDRALMRIAGLLKRLCGEHNCFGARYGGDEFVLIYEGSAMDGSGLCRMVQQAVEAENAQMEGRCPYRLSLSVGYAVYHNGITSIPEFIEQADQQLYVAKKNRK